MMQRLLRTFLTMALLLAFETVSAKNEPTGLVCNLLVRPELTVVTTPNPQFGWVIPPSKTNEKQTAFRILVSSSKVALYNNTGDMWDSGKLHSSQSQHILYKGKAGRR